MLHTRLPTAEGLAVWFNGVLDLPLSASLGSLSAPLAGGSSSSNSGSSTPLTTLSRSGTPLLGGASRGGLEAGSGATPGVSGGSGLRLGLDELLLLDLLLSLGLRVAVYTPFGQ